MLPASTELFSWTRRDRIADRWCTCRVPTAKRLYAVTKQSTLLQLELRIFYVSLLRVLRPSAARVCALTEKKRRLHFLANSRILASARIGRVADWAAFLVGGGFGGYGGYGGYA